MINSIDFLKDVGFLEKIGLFYHGSLESLVTLALLLLPTIYRLTSFRVILEFWDYCGPIQLPFVVPF